MSVSEPGKIITPWAESGLKNAIPAAANPATGRAGFDQGFSAINMTAKEAGGIPPFGQDFNGIFYEVTNILRYMQAGGQPTFSATLASGIGGYPVGAMILGDDGVAIYTNRVDGNSSNPNSGGSGWAREDLMLREALRRSYAEAGLNLVEGSFELGGVLSGPNDVLLYEKDCSAWAWVGAYPHNVPEGTIPVIGSGYVPRTDVLLRDRLAGNWADDSGLSINITDTPLLPSSADNRIKWERSRASLRAGVRDTVPLDDPLSHFRGLIDKNTWDDPAYHGVGSLSFGRNGAAYAYLSATLGHDCVSYGVAALSGGAGSCTGNPDIPGDGANYGYCSIGWGKYSQALGRISYAFGEECISGSLNSVAMGWKSKTGPCVAGMPNPIGAGPVLSEGRAATALGHYVEAYGDGATAIGHNIKCYNGAMMFGYGINSGSPIVNAIPGAVGLAANSDVIGVQVTPAPGTNGGFSRIGLNTTFPNQRIEAVLKHTDTVAFRLNDGEESANLALQRTVDGVISDVVSIKFNSSGIGALLMNGEQVLGGRALAISDNQTLENKVQAILDTLRSHGLIAS